VLERDPAARSRLEVSSVSGLWAVWVHRISTALAARLALSASAFQIAFLHRVIFIRRAAGGGCSLTMHGCGDRQTAIVGAM